MNLNTIITGDALNVLKAMEAESVNMCVTSPPYFGLRDYGIDGQLGLEGSPERYTEKIVEIFREVRRILKPDGTLWLNIGDSYATSSGPQAPKNTRNSQGHTRKHVPDGYKIKDLIGIPWMVAFALRSDGWYLRQDIIWNKTNCMPESVRDRCTRSHEYVFMFSKRPRYYYDAEAISEPITGNSTERYLRELKSPKEGTPHLPRFGGNKYVEGDQTIDRRKDGATYIPKLRKNKRDVWSVCTGGFKGAHFAVFPPQLVRPCILAGSKAGGVVLDPFMGSGTTAIVCIEEGRNFIGIELNPEYVAMANSRILEAKER